MKKKVSIVVPVFNEEKYIPITLDHVLHQDYEDLEIIVVDNKSTDRTRDVLRDFVKSVESDEVSFASGFRREGGEVVLERTYHPRYPRNREIRLVFNDENLGLARSLNRGFDLAAGEYIHFLAGDNIPHPQMISTLVAAVESNGADFAYGDMFIVDDAGRILRKFALPEFDFKKSLADWYLIGGATLWRRGLGGRLDPSLSSALDHDLFLRFAMDGAKFVHVPKVLYSVRHHDVDANRELHTPEMRRKAIEEGAALAERAREWLVQEVNR